MVRIPQRKVTKCNTYNHSFFFTIVFLQFSIKFCFSGCLVLITNSKLVISVGKRRGFSRRLCELTREKFSMRQEQVNIIFIQSSKKVSSSRDIHSNENHSLLAHSMLLNRRFRQSEKRNNTLSQMRIRSVFKMRTSILNTATTEQMGQGIISFFVYTKSTNYYFHVICNCFFCATQSARYKLIRV